MSRLLVSVRSAGEARAALAGGCDLLDAKEPAQGSLGAVSTATLADIVAVAGTCPVSAALGELPETGPLPVVQAEVALVKVGLAGWAARDWQRRLSEVHSPRLVVAAYADAELAEAPTPEAVLDAAIGLNLAAFLIDTQTKDGRSLLDWLALDRLTRLVRLAREARLPIALAGSLTFEQMDLLRPLEPDWFAVRGAACVGGRSGTVSTANVRRLAELLHSLPPQS